jgi:hypothetical protein
MSASSKLIGGLTSLPAGHSLRLGAARQGPPPPGSTALAAASASASAQSLRSRLSSFLPALAAANVDVAARIASEGSAAVDVESVEEGERHIEMNVAITDLGCDEEGEEEGEEGEEGEGRGEGVDGRGGVQTRRQQRPRIEELAAGGGEEEEDDDDEDEGEGGDGVDPDGRLRAGAWITNPSALQSHRAAIMAHLFAAPIEGEEEGEGHS